MGITMYVFALTHHWWSRFLPILKIGGNIWLFSPFEIMGVTAFILLTPVFITSNDWSVRTLGHFWRTVHALVYIVVWLLFLHIALQGVGWRAFGTLIIASFELFSLIWAKVSNPAREKPPQTPSLV
jgi:sulfoxide reductase heme-binding subunit YedZ